MGLIPDTKTGKIAFYQSKIAPWTTNAVAIGTTATAVAELDTKLTTAQDALAAQDAATEAAKTATATANNAISALTAAGADILRQIRAKGAITGDSVYELAQIPAPATPTPVGPPGTPYKLGVTLRPTGALEFTWKCDNPTGSVGTIYNVYRALEGSDDFKYLGGTGTRNFVDHTLPAGSTNVTYQIQAVRSTAVGVENEFVVKFGTRSSGAMTATIVEKLSKKAAA
jgi:hypothetical protein